MLTTFSLSVFLTSTPSVLAQYDTPLNTTSESVGWVYAPNYRSTSDIIFSCLLTMGLCVWSALHLNIRAQDETKLRTWIRNIGWVGLGVFGPELVMFAAWKQWASARALQHMMQAENKCSSCKAEQRNNTRSMSETSVKSRIDAAQWTVLHGYYATMGGFVIDLDSQTASILLDKKLGPTRMTITPQGLQLLAQCDLIPDVEEREILDKNKSDSLAKALVLLQASWMLIQAIARLSYSLPITLLEVNTIGHVICALFIYCLWWKKPRDVEEPTILKGAWVAALAAYMVMSSDLDDTGGWLEWVTLKPAIAPELSNLTFHRESTSSSSALVGPKSGTAVQIQSQQDDEVLLRQVTKSGFGSLGFSELPSQEQCNLRRQQSFRHHFDATNLENHRQSERWKLTLEAMSLFPHLTCRMLELRNIVVSKDKLYTPQYMLQQRAGNWPNKGSIPPYEGKVMGIALWFASIAFAAVHVAAWNEYFPSLLEKWLWRSSSLYLAWAGGIWLSINVLALLSKSFAKLWDTADTGRASKWAYFTLIPICTVCGLSYAFARTFLVVEAVISLRQMPPNMYITPNWPQIIPHL